MDTDPFVAATRRVAVAGRAVCDSIESAVGALSAGAAAREAGVPLIDVVDELIGAGGREARLATAEAFHEFERTLAEMRAGVVLSLVEDAGLSLTEVGRHLHISRQAVARLQRQGEALRDSARKIT